jgi:hypothetical protein
MQKFAAGKFHGVPPCDTNAIPIPVPLKGATISGLVQVFGRRQRGAMTNSDTPKNLDRHRVRFWYRSPSWHATLRKAVMEI